jgi:hypothetical protein
MERPAGTLHRLQRCC